METTMSLVEYSVSCKERNGVKMDVRSLPHECIVELKLSYFSELVNEGVFGIVMFGDDSISEPSIEVLASADDYISDDFIHEYYDGIDFVKDDFFCMMEMSYDEWDELERKCA